MKNIIYFGMNHEKYVSGYYYNDLVSSFNKKHNVFFYGPGHEDYNINDNIKNVLDKSKKKFLKPDLLIISNSWGNENPADDIFDFHPKINLSTIKNTKKVFLINKEYKKLRQKLTYISENKFDIVATVLSKDIFQEWANKTNTKFISLPFAVNLDVFKFKNLEKKYDFSFSGALHTDFIDIRINIKRKIFQEKYLKNLSNKYLINNPLQSKYRNYSFFWSEWGATNFLGKNNTPHGKKYIELLNKSKISLNTLSAMNIFNTRFFELMAMKSLIFCPRSTLKYDILMEDYNCIVFEDDLSDFEEKLQTLISGNYDYSHIVENAFNNSFTHTYDNRVDQLIESVF